MGVRGQRRDEPGEHKPQRVPDHHFPGWFGACQGEVWLPAPEDGQVCVGRKRFTPFNAVIRNAFGGLRCPSSVSGHRRARYPLSAPGTASWESSSSVHGQGGAGGPAAPAAVEGRVGSWSPSHH